MNMAKIKLCGLFRPEDIAYANAAKPDFCGFVIQFPRSHRSVSPGQVRQLRAALADEIIPVGVFVDQPPELVADLLRDGTIGIAQLHGHEDNAYMETLRALRGNRPGCQIWKAFRIRAAEDLNAVRDSAADCVLLDNGYGTGTAFDWSLLENMENINRPWILAGGLTPDNIRQAVRTFRPWGVDISSGIETNQIKDRQKMLAAVAAVREE